MGETPSFTAENLRKEGVTVHRDQRPLRVDFQSVVLPGDFSNWAVVIFQVLLPLHGSYGSSGRFTAGNFDLLPLVERGKGQTVQT